MYWENWKPYIFNVATCPIHILMCLQWGWHINNLPQPKIDKNFTGDTHSHCQKHDITLARFEWHCVIFSAKWLRPHSRQGRSLFITYSRHPETFTGHFFNEKEAKLVCLVLPAGCHYDPLESSLRESAGPIVPKVPRTASWGAWLPLSAFIVWTCLRDWFPRQRHWRATYFFSALKEKAARQGYPWVHLFRPFHAIG